MSTVTQLAKRTPASFTKLPLALRRTPLFIHAKVTSPSPP
jgi:hypothetical protein